MQKKINITAGKKNLISDIEGIKVGNAENIKLNTGLISKNLITNIARQLIPLAAHLLVRLNYYSQITPSSLLMVSH